MLVNTWNKILCFYKHCRCSRKMNVLQNVGRIREYNRIQRGSYTCRQRDQCSCLRGHVDIVSSASEWRCVARGAPRAYAAARAPRCEAPRDLAPPPSLCVSTCRKIHLSIICRLPASLKFNPKRGFVVKFIVSDVTFTCFKGSCSGFCYVSTNLLVLSSRCCLLLTKLLFKSLYNRLYLQRRFSRYQDDYSRQF